MTYPEEKIRELAIEAINQLGENASPEAIAAFIEQRVSAESSTPVTFDMKAGERVILTSFGMNHPGVVASISGLLSQNNCDILDVSQKIMQEFFTMIMLLDLTRASVNLKELQDQMKELSQKLNIKIYLQHEDIFRQMHRV